MDALRRRLIGGGIVLLAVCSAVVLTIRQGIHTPADIEPVSVSCPPDSPALLRGDTVRVLVWNIQYGAPNRYHFFYDGGDDVYVDEQDVRANLDALAEVVRDVDPDVILWQEVDRGSRRTHHIDQHAELLARVPYPCHLSTPYHRAGYVPHPPEQHIGKVDMHLSIFSRYALGDARRIQLALLDEPWWRQIFNLRRALLDATIPLAGGGDLHLLNTHLSAFSKGDGTLGKQMARLDQEVASYESKRQPWVLAGDFNALPPGDTPSRLGDDAQWYAEDVTPIQRLFDRYASVIPTQQYAADPTRWFTYMPHGAEGPDRTLDYVFAGRAVEVGTVEVRQETTLSDHMPIVVELHIPEEP